MPKTRDELKRWTEIMFGFVEPLEHLLVEELGRSNLLVAGRLKTSWLSEDLHNHGLTSAQIALLPRCKALPPLDSDAKILGVCYVMEGSTLGGQMISQHIESKLGLKNGVGYRYFRSYGPEVGRRWQDFRALLLQQSNPRIDDEIVASADETFRRLRLWGERYSR